MCGGCVLDVWWMCGGCVVRGSCNRNTEMVAEMVTEAK